MFEWILTSSVIGCISVVMLELFSDSRGRPVHGSRMELSGASTFSGRRRWRAMNDSELDALVAEFASESDYPPRTVANLNRRPSHA